MATTLHPHPTAVTMAVTMADIMVVTMEAIIRITVTVHLQLYMVQEIPEVEELLGETGISLGESQMRRWFNIAPSGEIEWPNLEQEEGED